MFKQFQIQHPIGGKKYYFASDFHFGSPNYAQSRARENQVVRWLNQIQPSCQALYLLGDQFDFWYEHKHTIPKGFVRFQAKIAEFVDHGIPVHLFTGNHDMWMFDYLETELGVTIHRQQIELLSPSHTFLIGHGDGLGPKDYWYKFFRVFFRNHICQWLFGRIHPNTSMWLAQSWSNKSRKKGNKQPHTYQADQEWILQHCKEQELKKHHDFYIYGHRHLTIDTPVAPQSRYINLGEWYSQCHYASYDGQELILQKFEG